MYAPTPDAPAVLLVNAEDLVALLVEQLRQQSSVLRGEKLQDPVDEPLRKVSRRDQRRLWRTSLHLGAHLAWLHRLRLGLREGRRNRRYLKRTGSVNTSFDV